MMFRETKLTKRWSKPPPLCYGCLLIVFIAFCQDRLTQVEGVKADSDYSLKPPAVYRALSGDLHVNYSTPLSVVMPHAFVRLEYWSKSAKRAVEIQTLGLPLGRHSGTLIFACGVIELAGSYTLRMFTHRGGKQLAQVTMNILWPEVSLSLPDDLTALKQKAKLIVISTASCESKRAQYDFRIRLIHQHSELSASKAVAVAPNVNEVATSNDTVANQTGHPKEEQVAEMKLGKIDQDYTDMDLGCHLFDLAGLYQARLVSSSPDAPVVATSNFMRVSWGANDYQIYTLRRSVFPCSDSASLRVIYSHPPCAGKNDRVRLFSSTRSVSGSPAAPLDRKYVIEMKANPNSGEVYLDCNLFSADASGFCLTYVSVTRGDVFLQQKETCLPAYPNSVFPTAGSWGSWASWGACSVTCGVGKRQRFRLCDSPPPKHGGEYCPGRHVQWSSCVQHCPDSMPRTPLHSPVIDPSCPCGCEMSATNQGRIVATGRCQGLAVWTLRVDPGWEIVLTFEYFHLNFTRQWVRVRDGKSPSNRLLFSSADPGYSAEVISSGDVVRLEFMTLPVNMSISKKTPPASAPMAKREFVKEASLPIHINGFILTYRSSSPPPTTTGPLLFPYQEKKAIHSPVALAGIAICAAAVVVAVVFVIIQRVVAKGRIKYAMASSPTTDSPTNQEGSNEKERGGDRAQGDSPARTQSSTPSSHGNAIHVDHEVPLTGKLRRKADGSADSTKAEKSEKTGDLADRDNNHKKNKKTRFKVNIEVNHVAVEGDQGKVKATTLSTSSVTSGGLSGSSGLDRTSATAPKSVKYSYGGLEVIDTDEVETLVSKSNTCTTPTSQSHKETESSTSSRHGGHRKDGHRRHKRHHDRSDKATKYDLLRKMRERETPAGEHCDTDVKKSDKHHKRSRSDKCNTAKVPPAPLPTLDLERDITGSSGSRSPISVSTTRAEVNWPQREVGTSNGGGEVGGSGGIMRAALNEVASWSFTSPFSSSLSADRRRQRPGDQRHHNTQQYRRPPSEEIPLMDSMTSSLESPSHFNAMVKSESQDSATTSFVNRGSIRSHPRARRPTSLTASYNSNVSNEDVDTPCLEDSISKPGDTTASTITQGSSTNTVIPRPTKPSPSALTPSQPSSIPPPPSYTKSGRSASSTSSSSSQPHKPPDSSNFKQLPGAQAQHPSSHSSLAQTMYKEPPHYSKHSLPSKAPVPNTSAIVLSASPLTPVPMYTPKFDSRLANLPKPDGQSPKLAKREVQGSATPDSPSRTLTRTPRNKMVNGDSQDCANKTTPLSIKTQPIDSSSHIGKAPLAAVDVDSLSPPRPHLSAKSRNGSERNEVESPAQTPTADSYVAKSFPEGKLISGQTQGLGQVSPASQLSRSSSKMDSMASPARSLPSEVEGLELEYDDFIEDDPLSYFDYEETQKLTFRGIERIGCKAPIEEDEEDEG